MGKTVKFQGDKTNKVGKKSTKFQGKKQKGGANKRQYFDMETGGYDHFSGVQINPYRF